MATDTYKKGQLHRMLQIPEDTKIPFTLLEKIRTAEIGTTVENPTKIGKPKVKVTKLLKQRAVRALTWKRIGQKAKENKEGTTSAKRSITGQGRVDIHYITKSGRVIPAKDMGATVYRVSPSGRTTKSARLSDRKRGRKKGGKCPSCGSMNTEPSWGAEGYLQCNNCGAEWRHPRGHTAKGSRTR